MTKRALGDGARCCGQSEGCDIACDPVAGPTEQPTVPVATEDEPTESDPFDEEDDE